MLIHHETRTPTGSDDGWTDSATWKSNTSHTLHGILKQIYIEPTTSTTTYKFKLLDNNDRVVFDTEDFQENIMNRFNLDLPLKGIYEMQLYLTSAQEQFKILLSMQED